LTEKEEFLTPLESIIEVIENWFESRKRHAGD
jgi:hypothetical protein